MASAKKPAAPSGLGAKAKAVWSGTLEVYDLRPDELRVLEDACREVDLIERIEKELAKADLIVQGSMGQPVANPLTTEIRQHRATFARLMAALKLPTDPAGEVADSPRSVSARKAAQARWSGQRGA